MTSADNEPAHSPDDTTPPDEPTPVQRNEGEGTDVQHDVRVDDPSVPGDDTDDLVDPDPNEEDSDDDGEDPADESEDDASPRTREIVTEALGPRLSRRAVLTASGLAVAVALGSGLISGLTTGNPRSVEMSSLTNASTTEVAPRDSSGVAEKARESVFKIEVGSQSGSSFLIEPTTLMTNAHVTAVDVGKTVKVTNSSGKDFKGTVLMKDPDVDVALIDIPKQKADPLPFVGVGDQSAGQPLSLLGYPLGLDVTVTSGTASAIDTATSLRESPGQHSLLQIDAAVNPGSSGGPVLDSRGRVMGMATSRPDSVGSRPVQGIAFAVPANDLTVAVTQFNEHGDVKYGYLGVSMNSHSPKNGATISGVTDGSPAESVGLKEGDVITAVGEYPTASYTEVSRFLHMFRPGEKVQLTVKSGDKTRTVDVALGESTD